MKYLITILIIVLLTACQQQADIDVKKISVSEVRSYYNELQQQPNFRVSSEIPNPEILWDEGIYEEMSLGDALLFPLDYEDQAYLSDSTQNIIMSAESNFYGFAYKQNNEVHFELVKAVKTANTEEFTGYVLVEDWLGNKLRYFNFANGEFMGEHEIVEGVENQRTDEFVYNCVTTIYYTCWGDIPADCREDSRSTVCTVKEVKELHGEPGAGGVDYGPAGPSKSGINQATCDPDLGYFQDADGNCVREECAEGQIRDENGDCVCEMAGGRIAGDCDSESCSASPCCDDSGNILLNCLEDIPCSGNPLVGMEITSPGKSGKAGGRYGCARPGTHPSCPPKKRLHDGIDLTASLGTYVFTASPGRVVQIRKNFEKMEYRVDSYGNFVVIESTIQDGSKIRMKYNHLSSVQVSVGQVLDIGMLIGQTGITGNASSRHVTPHLHLQCKVKIGNSWMQTDPENYLASVYDENGELVYDPCTN